MPHHSALATLPSDDGTLLSVSMRCSSSKLAANGQQLEANKEIVREFFERLSEGDVDGVVELYTDRCTCWVAGTLPFSGTQPREALPQLIAGVAHMFPDGLRFDVKSLTAEADRVSAEAESFGRHISGQIYNQIYHYLFVIRDGKIDNYQAVVPSTWNAGPRDPTGQPGAYEAALMDNHQLAIADQPLEIQRTIHSLDPCIACAVHVTDPDGEELVQVKVN